MNELELDNEFEEVDPNAPVEIDYSVAKPVVKTGEESLATFGVDIFSLTDETITDEMIKELELMGIARPPNISNVRWHAVEKESVMHTHMLHLRIAGMTYEQIAAELGYSLLQVMKVIRSPIIQSKIQSKMEEIYGKDYKKTFTKRAAKAIMVYDEILEDKTVRPQVRLAAAQHIMEHTIGKPQQTIEHKGSLLAEVIAKADQLHDITNSSNDLPKEPNAFDNLLKEIVPSGVTVGKRSSGEIESE